MAYDIFDHGYSIILVRQDGKSVVLMGDEATYFRDDFQASPSDWDVSRFIKEFEYDLLF